MIEKTAASSELSSLGSSALEFATAITAFMKPLANIAEAASKLIGLIK